MIIIIADDKTFNIDVKRLETEKESSLYSLISSPDAVQSLPDLIIKKIIDKNGDHIIYVDVNADIMSYLIGKLRGYDQQAPSEDIKNVSNLLKFSFYKTGLINALPDTKSQSIESIINEVLLDDQTVDSVSGTDTKHEIVDTKREILDDVTDKPNVLEDVKTLSSIFEPHNEPNSDKVLSGGEKKKKSKTITDNSIFDTDRQKDISKMFERSKTSKSVESDDFSLFSSDVLSIISASQGVHEIKKKDKKSKSRHLSIDSVHN